MAHTDQTAIGARAYDILTTEYAGKTVSADDMKAIRERAAREVEARKQKTSHAIATVHLAAVAG